MLPSVHRATRLGIYARKKRPSDKRTQSHTSEDRAHWPMPKPHADRLAYRTVTVFWPSIAIASAYVSCACAKSFFTKSALPFSLSLSCAVVDGVISARRGRPSWAGSPHGSFVIRPRGVAGNMLRALTFFFTHWVSVRGWGRTKGRGPNGG